MKALQSFRLLGPAHPVIQCHFPETYTFRINVFCSFALTVLLEYHAKFEILAAVTVRNTIFPGP